MTLVGQQRRTFLDQRRNFQRLRRLRRLSRTAISIMAISQFLEQLRRECMDIMAQLIVIMTHPRVIGESQPLVLQR